MTRIATEFSLFNKLKYGKPRSMNSINVSEKINDNNSFNEVVNEKLPDRYDNDKLVEPFKPGQTLVNLRLVKKLAVGLMIIIAVLITSYQLYVAPSIFKPNLPHQLKILNENILSDNATAREIFEVKYPIVVKPSYGDSLFTKTLVDHYFGQSWGKPAIVDYSPPENLTFNKVVVTLDTKSEGVQYDRLAHFFINGVTLWRTSTMEPGGHKVHSKFLKDVSEYVSLFQNNGTIVFQLDNLINTRLTGGFDVKLTVDYYYDVTVEESGNDNSINAILSDNSVPKIFGLGVNGVTDALSYLPLEKFIVNLPRLNLNSTRLKLAIFTSGNAEEEFWYSNVLNRYVNKYKSNGVDLIGHGPIRVVTVKYNDKIISQSIPEPVIFTGGLSPALWSPMVSTSAFDIKSIDLDLTSLLPNLTSTDKLEISIDNGQIDDGKIGSNWITSANLHVWENSNVKSTTGEIFDSGFDAKKSIIDIGWQDVNQIIDYNSNANISSNVIYELLNGSTINTNYTFLTSGSISNIQSYKNGGYKQSVVHAGKFAKELLITNNADDSIISNLKTKFDYPIILSLDLLKTGQEVVYDISIVNGKTILVDDESVNVLTLNDIQNGTSSFTLSSSGNHGTGKTEVKYRLNNDNANIHYYRHVKVDFIDLIGYDYENFDGKDDEVHHHYS